MEDYKERYLKIVNIIKRVFQVHNIEPDAEANTLSIYYKVDPSGLFQNTLRIANHATTAKRMFGTEKRLFPSTDENGNVTVYIYVDEIVNLNTNKTPDKVPDYLNERKKITTIDKKRYERLKDLYPKDSEGNLLFPYKMHLFDSKKFFDENQEFINEDAVRSIGESGYAWYLNGGRQPFIISEKVKFAFMQTVECTGIVKKPRVNEFVASATQELDFCIGYIGLIDSKKEVEKLDVLLHVKNLPGFLLREFIREYGLPVSNNFKRRKTVEVDTESMKASELLKKYFIEAGFPEEDIAVRQESNGLILDIKDNTTKILFATIMAARENISYVEVCKKYGI